MATYLDELVQKIITKADLKGFDDLEKKQKRAEKNSKKLGNSSSKAFDDIERGAERAKQSVNRYERSLNRANKSTAIMGKFLRRTIGYYFGIQGVRSIIQTTRDLDLLQKSIKGLTGSVQDWQFLRQEAYRTGTSLKTIAGAYKNFYSAARGSGFNGNQIQGMFSGLLTAGRGIGASQQQIGGALVALEQMLSKGKVSAEELRKQLGNALPGAVEIAQRAMGVTGAQFEEMMKKGISAAEFVPKFIAQAEKELGKGFKENIKSLDFALVNLNTAWMEFQANILKGEAGEALAQLVRDVTKILRSQTLLRFVQMIGKALAFIFKHIKLILFLFGAKKVLEYTMAIKKLHVAIIGLSGSTVALGAVTRTLASGYAFLAGGQIITGLKMITAGLWAMVAPTALIAAKFTAIIAGILMLQDLMLAITDPEADTYSGALANFVNSKVDAENPTPTQMPFANPSVVTPQFQVRDEDTLPYKFKQWRARHSGVATGGAAPIFGTDFQTPNAGYYGTLPNLNGNYNNSENRKIENNISISISAPNSQPDTIAQSVEDVLQKFFTKYEMSFA